jgi:hypothetical protein
MGISNSFHGSKLFLNAGLPEATDYIERFSSYPYVFDCILLNSHFVVSFYSDCFILKKG